jgi:hypothetical protein
MRLTLMVRADWAGQNRTALLSTQELPDGAVSTGQAA